MTKKFRHINTGIERELKVGNALISVLENSPSWEELGAPTPVAEPKEEPKAKK